MFQTIKDLLGLIRFSHTLFALPFALMAAVMAWRLVAIETPPTQPVIDPYTLESSTISESGSVGAHETYVGGVHDTYLRVGSTTVPMDWWFLKRAMLAIRWQETVGILLCMVTARSAAMAFNRLVDRKLDAHNPRTADRHLPAGILSAQSVWLFFAASVLGFIASTLLFLPNRLPLYLSVPVLIFLCGYSYSKRFTTLAHFWLGTALALSPVAAWIAIRGEVLLANPSDLLPAIVLGGAVLSWVSGFDILYACQDYEYDRTTGLHSVPVRLGIRGSLWLAAACHAVTVVLLACLPLVYPPLGWIYGVGIMAVALLLLYEHALVRPDDLTRVNTAFFHVNAVISIGLFAVSSLDLLLGSG